MTSGARSDFQQATREARHMVTECGMSEDIGPVFVENTESPDMRRRIDGEVSRILRDAYARVKTLLVGLPTLMHALRKSSQLLQAEVKNTSASKRLNM